MKGMECCPIHLDAAKKVMKNVCILSVWSLQEVSFEEYEAQLAAKKAALNKPKAEIKVDLDAFKGMRTYVRAEVVDVVTGVELTTAAKKAAAADEDKAEKARKQVG